MRTEPLAPERFFQNLRAATGMPTLSKTASLEVSLCPAERLAVALAVDALCDRRPSVDRYPELATALEAYEFYLRGFLEAQTSKNPVPLTNPLNTNQELEDCRWCWFDSDVTQRLDDVYGWALLDPEPFRWKFGSVIPNQNTFVSALLEGTLCGFNFGSRGSSVLDGVLICHSANFASHTAAIAWSVSAGGSDQNALAEALCLFGRYLFATWSFRKLYLYLPSFQEPPIHGLLPKPLAQLEGCLRQHLYRDGTWYDQHIYAMYRDDLTSFFELDGWVQ
jgi:hypothetical protein